MPIFNRHSLYVRPEQDTWVLWTNQPFWSLNDIFNSKAIMFGILSVWRVGAKLGHTDNIAIVAHPTTPAQRCTGLDGQAGFDGLT